MKSNRRYDLSQRLIHFCRNLDLSDGSAPVVPESFGPSNMHESEKFSAFFLLRSAIRHGHLWATWARRNSIRTIYGHRPAVCFTDMPTAAFLETSTERRKAGQKISTLALTFQKSQMFNLGARPVIYGLSERGVAMPGGKGGGPRIIPIHTLPLDEQFRYVSYYPTGRWRVDWTHEREWRWPFSGDLTEFESEIAKFGIIDEVTDIPGLGLYEGHLNGIGVIVNTEEEAEMVLHDIVTLVDRGVIDPDTFSYVLASDRIHSPHVIRDPDAEEEVIAAAAIDLSDYLRSVPERDELIAERIHALAQQVEAEAGFSEFGEFGSCWLWLMGNGHPVIRSLINTDRIVINTDGKYLMFPYEFSDNRSLKQREVMTQKLAQLVSQEFRIEAGYFSVLMSDDPDGLPSYNDDHMYNKFSYNWAFYGLDPVADSGLSGEMSLGDPAGAQAPPPPENGTSSAE